MIIILLMFWLFSDTERVFFIEWWQGGGGGGQLKTQKLMMMLGNGKGLMGIVLLQGISWLEMMWISLKWSFFIAFSYQIFLLCVRKTLLRLLTQEIILTDEIRIKNQEQKLTLKGIRKTVHIFGHSHFFFEKRRFLVIKLGWN